MKCLLVIMIALLSGCGGLVTEEEWAVYEKLCAPNGGIQQVDKFYDTTLVCKNGAKFSQYILEKELKKK